MGIYTNGSILGIRIYQQYETTTDLLKTKTNQPLNGEQMKNAYAFYQALENKENIFFHIYTECCSTKDSNTFMAWFPITLETFLETFLDPYGKKIFHYPFP
jgi:hypothetical protein